MSPNFSHRVQCLGKDLRQFCIRVACGWCRDTSANEQRAACPHAKRPDINIVHARENRRERCSLKKFENKSNVKTVEKGKMLCPLRADLKLCLGSKPYPAHAKKIS